MTIDQAVKYDFGIIGLGTMGRNLLLNMADHDMAVAGYDQKKEQVSLLETEGSRHRIKGFLQLNEFISELKKPRAIMLLVPAGKVVDDVLSELIPLIDKGDLIIDGGNSKFTDTEARSISMTSKGFNFFGMGISGGEEGARRGPSMMPGGDPTAFEHIRPILEAISAKVAGEPCVTYIGPGASGHFVKMVHNGIEYALMQLIAETYDILKTGLEFQNNEIRDLFKSWNEGYLQSFLLEITRDIFDFTAPENGHLLLDDIKDEAKSKGTGKWTSQFAMDLQCPIPCIDIAVSMRDLSKYKSIRTRNAMTYPITSKKIHVGTDLQDYLKVLQRAFYFGTVNIHAQGMHLLSVGSHAYGYKLQLDQIAKIWRGGCIIRSSFLEDIYAAFNKNKNLEHLFLNDLIQSTLVAHVDAARTIVASSMNAAISVPVFAASVNYFDAFTTEHLPTNLIQAQRDLFGSHTYELIGKEGVFHTNWSG